MRLSVVAVVIANPPSLKTLPLVTSAIVRVAMVGAAAGVMPAVLFDFNLLYIYPPNVWAEVPLKLTVPVEQVKVPPVLRFPPKLSIPAPENKNLDCAAVPPKVMLPVTFIVPVETDTSLYLVTATPPPNVILAALNAPEPTEIVLLKAPVGVVMEIAPVTVSEYGLFMRIPLPPVPAVGAAIVKVLHASVPSTVTIQLVGIVTSSPDPGTTPPVHVEVELQLPVAAAEIAAALILLFIVKNIAKAAILSFNVLKCKKVLILIGLVGYRLYNIINKKAIVSPGSAPTGVRIENRQSHTVSSRYTSLLDVTIFSGNYAIFIIVVSKNNEINPEFSMYQLNFY